jgi:hypothetical protein
VNGLKSLLGLDDSYLVLDELQLHALLLDARLEMDLNTFGTLLLRDQLLSQTSALGVGCLDQHSQLGHV